VVGSGFCPNDQADTNGQQISLEEFQTLKVTSDGVWVGAGINWLTLAKFLA
jgi:hypothetical protein